MNAEAEKPRPSGRGAVTQWIGCYFDAAEAVGYVFDNRGREVKTSRAQARAQIEIAGTGGIPLRVQNKAYKVGRRPSEITVYWDALGRFGEGLARETGARWFQTKGEYDRTRDYVLAAHTRHLALEKNSITPV